MFRKVASGVLGLVVGAAEVLLTLFGGLILVAVAFAILRGVGFI